MPAARQSRFRLGSLAATWARGLVLLAALLFGGLPSATAQRANLPTLDYRLQARALAETGAIMAVSGGIRRFGSAALDLAWMAAGRVDGFWEHGINIWDTAAGIVLVREAGGVVSDFQGRTDALKGDEIVCANEHLHPQLLKILKTAGKGEGG